MASVLICTLFGALMWGTQGAILGAITGLIFAIGDYLS
jgi:hypothetical protein